MTLSLTTISFKCHYSECRRQKIKMQHSVMCVVMLRAQRHSVLLQLQILNSKGKHFKQLFQASGLIFTKLVANFPLSLFGAWLLVTRKKDIMSFGQMPFGRH
jgi:hypothetical protein